MTRVQFSFSMYHGNVQALRDVAAIFAAMKAVNLNIVPYWYSKALSIYTQAAFSGYLRNVYGGHTDICDYKDGDNVLYVRSAETCQTPWMPAMAIHHTLEHYGSDHNPVLYSYIQTRDSNGNNPQYSGGVIFVTPKEIVHKTTENMLNNLREDYFNQLPREDEQ